MLRQVRCSPFGTKLKINSSAISRRASRSASLKSCLRPRGARLENACANCKRIYGSNASQTDRQYCAVDFHDRSFHLLLLQPAQQSPQVARHGRKSSPLRLAVRCTRIDHHNHQHFLVYVNSGYLVGHASSRRGSGRTHAKRRYTPSRATTLPAGTGGATQIGSKRAFQIKLGNGLTLSRVATTFTVPRRLDRTPPTLPNFHGNGCAAGSCETRK